MKMNINIQQENFLGEIKTIVDIDINNGNWKYWDRYCEGEEKQTLTINNMHDMNIINQPVKDAIPIWDNDIWENERELVVADAGVRTYNSLLTYLNCRIGNAKEQYKKYGRLYQKWTAVLFDGELVLSKDDSVVRDIKFEQDGVIEITIRVIE